jgi:hypothetical protein
MVRRRRAKQHAGRRNRKAQQGTNAGLADPRIKAVLADQGGTPLPGSQADLGKLIVGETEKWAKVVEAATSHP